MAIHRHWLVLSGVVAAVAIALWVQRPREVKRGAFSTPPSSTTAPDAGKSTLDIKHQNSVGAVPVPASVPPGSLRKRLRTATGRAEDMYAFAKEILPLAQAGNPEAQYVIAITIAGCEEGGNSHGAKSENLAAAQNEGLRVFPNTPQLASKFEAGYKRCHGFYTDGATNFGSFWDWLQKATDAGYAMAQATTAMQRLQQDTLKTSVRAGAAENDITRLAPIGGDADPRELLVAAAQGGDPEVFKQIADMQLILNPAQPRDVITQNSVAWKYIACQRGADCSEYGPATVTNCGPNDGNCTPVPNEFLHWVNNNWAPIQERVNQINAALNAKQWDQLGLSAAGG